MQERVGNGGFSLRRVSRFIEILDRYKDRKVLKSYFNGIKGFEDLFYSYEINRYSKKMRVPSKETALKFSFETEPIICYNLNNNQLPFGCHGWYKNDYFLNHFWNSFIKC